MNLTREFEHVAQFKGDKILQHMDRLAEWQKGGRPAPIVAEIDPTNACNLKCPYCSFALLNNDEFLEADTMVRVLGELADIGVRAVTFTGGGEPLCNPGTMAAVVAARERGLDVGFITNGVLLTLESAEIIVRHCQWCRVSLDADSPSLYKLMKGRSGVTFDRVVANIENLVAVKSSTGSSCTIGVGYLTCKDSIKGVLPAARLCKRIGVDYIQFRPVVVNSPEEFRDYSINVRDETEDAISKAFGEASETFKVLFSREKYGDFAKKGFGRMYDVCNGHHFATVIGASGDVWLCCHLRGRRKYSLGSIHKKSFSDIWFSAEREHVYSNINMAEDCVPLCRLHPQNKLLADLRRPVIHRNFI